MEGVLVVPAVLVPLDDVTVLVVVVALFVPLDDVDNEGVPLTYDPLA